ncbi:MAG: DinB family protein [Nocardioidaceae bacterium]|nr:DinB family protein [Nocardioidaceae bacterium]NUS50500.1 DinB family protein [Nocardioidaceae bacterium]
MLLGRLVVRALIWLIRGFSMLPPGASQRFAQALNAATRPFVVDSLGSIGGARVLGHAGMEAAMDRVTGRPTRTLEHASERLLDRGMHFPVGWDPPRDDMTGQDVLHYGTQHHQHHRRQLTLSNAHDH